MLPPPAEFLSLLQPFAPLFSERVLSHGLVLILGAILSPAKRTVTSALRITGRHRDPHFQNFHRVLSRAKWSCLGVGRILVGLVVSTFAPSGPLVIALDDTIERRRGAKIQTKGVYRDPVRSSQSHFVKTTGLRWLCFMFVVHIPWAMRRWALPFLTVLCPSQRYYEQRGRKHVSLLDRALQGVRLLRRWLPDRELVLVADSSFAAIDCLGWVRAYACVITRLRLDAALYEPVPARKPGTNGRPRKKGGRTAKLCQRVADKKTRWKKLTIAQWYGQPQRTIEIVTGLAVWYHSGKLPLAIRWVLIRDPKGQFEPQALLCTRQDLDAATILQFFTGRWQVEVTLQETREHLGVETQRQWSTKAIARTTPILLGLYSLVTLMARRLGVRSKLPVRTAAWYDKHTATFSDTIACVRRHIWGFEGFCTSSQHKDVVKVPRPILQALTDAIAYGN